MSYDKITLDIVKGSSILESKDFETLDNMKGELQDVFLHTQIFRTRTEMEVSILNDLNYPTPDSKYWQATREQNVMFHELVMLSYEYRKNLIEVKELESTVGKMENEFKEELNKIEIEKKRYNLLIQERMAKDRIRELSEWHSIKKQLVPNLEFSLEDCDEHQLISYTKRWVAQFEQMGTNSSPSERQNLIGQLEKGIKICSDKGLLEKVLPDEKQRNRLLGSSGTQ